MFLYGIGIQYGRQFFAGLRGDGLKWNALGAVAVVSSLAAAIAARDMSQATLSRFTGEEPRKAVERLLDLGGLAGGAAPATAEQARARVADWMSQLTRAWAAALWPR